MSNIDDKRLSEISFEAKMDIFDYCTANTLNQLDFSRIKKIKIKLLDDLEKSYLSGCVNLNSKDILIKNGSFKSEQEFKHIITHEYLHILSDNDKISGFMNSEIMRGINEGYTEILASLISPYVETIFYPSLIVVTFLFVEMIGNKKMQEYYFNNQADQLYNDIISNLKNKESIDIVLNCLTKETKLGLDDTSMLGNMEIIIMTLLIENGNINDEQYAKYRKIISTYNEFLLQLSSNMFKSCEGVLDKIDDLYLNHKTNSNVSRMEAISL